MKTLFKQSPSGLKDISFPVIIGPWFCLTILLSFPTLLVAQEHTAALSPQAFGARADGVHDDTEAIQAAIDAANKQGGATVLFPPGTYLVRSVDVNAGLTLIGYGATLKKKGQQPKFSRTFTTQNRKYLGEKDSPPLTIKGFTFDGNRLAQGAYENYALEQQHMIFLQGNPKGPGKLVAIIEDCTFHDGVADAVSVYTNVAATISNCRAIDVFRGGVVVTGGYTEVQISNFTAIGNDHATGIDVEVDGAGYGGTHRTHITATNLRLAGDLDIGIKDGSTFLGTNIYCESGPFNIYAKDSTVRIMNSILGVGSLGSHGNRIVFPHDVSFSHCTFVGDMPDKEATDDRLATIHIYWNISGTDERDQRLRFLDCDFQLSNTVPMEVTTYAVYAEADRRERNNRLLLRGGAVTSDFDYGVYINQGGHVSIADIAIDAAVGIRLGATAKYPLDVLLDSVRFGANTTSPTQIPVDVPESRIEYRNMPCQTHP